MRTWMLMISRDMVGVRKKEKNEDDEQILVEVRVQKKVKPRRR